MMVPMAATVLQLSDTHLTRRRGGTVSGADPDRRLAAVLDTWKAGGERADLVVVSGDDADDASPAAYTRLAEAMAGLDAPVLALAGNHDSPAAVAEAFPGPRSVEVGGWRMHGLDSSRPHDVHGTIDAPAELARLDELDRRPTVVALHHPPLSRSTNPWFRLDGGDELLAGLADRPYVRAVISGHLHDPFDLEGPGGLALLGCPSTLVPIAHHGDRYQTGHGGPTGARVLYLGDDAKLTSRIVEG